LHYYASLDLLDCLRNINRFDKIMPSAHCNLTSCTYGSSTNRGECGTAVLFALVFGVCNYDAQGCTQTCSSPQAYTQETVEECQADLELIQGGLGINSLALVCTQANELWWFWCRNNAL
jgi:hypothetical protein